MKTVCNNNMNYFLFTDLKKAMYLQRSQTTVFAAGRCSVCQEFVRRATKLQCDHVFCDKCVNTQKIRIDTMIELKHPVDIACPFCREYFYSLKEQRKEDTHLRRAYSAHGYERTGAQRERNLLRRCQPCLEGGEYTDSSYWCEDCSEYFCTTCSRYHQTMKMSKAHRMRPERGVGKSKYDMATKARSDSKERKKICDSCRKNDRLKNAAFCCNDCSENFCDDCSKCHRTMKISKNHQMRPINIVFIKVDKYNKDLKCSKHYGEPQSLYCKRCQISCCTVCAIATHSNCKTLAQGKENKDLYKYSSDHKKWELTDQIKSKDKDMSRNFYDSFSKMKDDRDRHFEDKWQTTKHGGKDRRYGGIPQLRMDVRKTRIGFGSASKDDWIISMAMLFNGDIMVISLYQPDLKLIDASGSVVSSCTFVGDPWSVAVYNDSLAAVTFSDRKQIQLVNISRGLLKQGKRITTRHKCLAVCFANNLIVASCWEGCIHVMDITGDEICNVKLDHRGERLFSNPEYIASNRSGDVIYVSDYKRNSITALKLLPTRFEKKPLFVFTDRELKGPKGITVDDDDIIYVSGMTSRNIFRLAPSGNKIQIFSRREDVEYYEDICVSRNCDKLYVSAYEDDTILVFTLKRE